MCPHNVVLCHPIPEGINQTNQHLTNAPFCNTFHAIFIIHFSIDMYTIIGRVLPYLPFLIKARCYF